MASLSQGFAAKISNSPALAAPYSAAASPFGASADNVTSKPPPCALPSQTRTDFSQPIGISSTTEALIRRVSQLHLTQNPTAVKAHRATSLRVPKKKTFSMPRERTEDRKTEKSYSFCTISTKQQIGALLSKRLERKSSTPSLQIKYTSAVPFRAQEQRRELQRRIESGEIVIIGRRLFDGTAIQSQFRPFREKNR